MTEQPLHVGSCCFLLSVRCSTLCGRLQCVLFEPNLTRMTECTLEVEVFTAPCSSVSRSLNTIAGLSGTGSLWENSCVRPGAGRLQLLRFVHVDSPTINLELPLIVAEERRGTPGSCWRWDCYSCYFLLDPVTYTQIFSNFSLICYVYK